MIVYASRLHLTDPVASGAVTTAVGTWLASKLRNPKVKHLAAQPGRHDLGRGHFLEVQRCEAADAQAYAVRYGHPDREIDAREWLTEVGVREAPGGSICTVLLHTRDQSTRVHVRPDTTRPLVVREILKHSTLRGSTPGGSPRPLTADDADAFGMMVRDRDRSHPVIQASPLPDGTYPIDPRRLAELVVGMAEVVSIPADEDTFALSDALGSHLSAYHGAINVLWPVVERSSGLFVPTTRLLATDLERAAEQGRLPERDILELLCHETNPRLARNHISPERVHGMLLRASLDSARKAASSAEDPELRELTQQIDGEQRAEIERLQKEVESRDRQLTAKTTELDEKDRELRQEMARTDALKAQLQRAGNSAACNSMSESDRRAIVSALDEDASLEQTLTAIAVLFADRIVVLDTASASARKAREFKFVAKARQMLIRLCTDYYDAILSGKGDREGTAIFGKSGFAARESETVENNKRARDLRRFTYNGETIEMMRHIKIGVKDSVAETFRAHFHWDTETKRIILGHCGKHLDHS